MVAVGHRCILKELKTVGEFLSIEGSMEGEDGSKIGPIEFLVDTGSEVFCLTESNFVRCKKELVWSHALSVFKVFVFNVEVPLFLARNLPLLEVYNYYYTCYIIYLRH